MRKAVAGVCSLLVPITLMWPQWIEAAFGLDPDHHSGAAELGFIFALGLVATSLGVLACLEWRRLRRA